MLRKDIETIVAKLAKLKESDKLKHVGHLQDLALTTNGYFLPERAHALKTPDSIVSRSASTV
jgi:molybdenum cofactor biosynthesis enzyme MoaA